MGNIWGFTDEQKPILSFFSLPSVIFVIHSKSLTSNFLCTDTTACAPLVKTPTPVVFTLSSDEYATKKQIWQFCCTAHEVNHHCKSHNTPTYTRWLIFSCKILERLKRRHAVLPNRELPLPEQWRRRMGTVDLGSKYLCYHG